MQKLLDILKQINEESSVGGGTTAGATMTPGTGEQVGTTKGFRPLRKKLKEAGGMMSKHEAVKHLRPLVRHVMKHNNIPGEFEEVLEKVMQGDDDILDQLWDLTNSSLDKHAINVLSKPSVSEDAPMLGAGKADISTYKKDGFTSNPSIPNRDSKAIDYKQMFEDSLNENYNQFRNKTKFRQGPDQFHQAIKEAKKKIHEVNKLMEYVDRLRNELNEGGEGFKHRSHTEKAISQIKESVVELYKKVKSFK